MNISTDISLKQYTTMQVGGSARFLTEATTAEEIPQIYHDAQSRQLPVFVLGGGSNVIAKDEGFEGVVLLNRIKGFEAVSEDEQSVTLKIGAGEVWDEVVARTVDMGLSGIEAMSAIPGTAGAAPVQNVGAYGQEIADTLVEVEAYDSATDAMVVLPAEVCHFSYRHSIFRGSQMGRYCITAITIRLSRRAPQPPFYAGLQRYLDEHHITDYTPAAIRQAVIAIRHDKLPDPTVTPNSGSFFKNAMVSQETLDAIRQAHPDVPNYAMPDGTYKIPTGWLIDQAGFRGKELHNMKIHDKNALVLTNPHAATYHDLECARQAIIQAVYDQFHVHIEQEPLEL
jgi:UDP-N-acetylmuramate dehydrogenase